MIGNLIDLAEQGKFNVIVHGCNCFHVMGAGIAKEIRGRYPDVCVADVQHSAKGDKSKLGKYSYAVVQGPAPYYWRFAIVNAYTQYGYGKGLQVSYNAVQQVFRSIKKGFPGARIGYPLIGAGLAGGDWNVIQTIINTELYGLDHSVVTLT